MLLKSFANIAYKSVLPIIIVLVIGHFIPDEYFYVYGALCFIVGLKFFFANWMSEHRQLKNIRKYQNDLKVKSYIPTFYCIQPKNYLGDTFHSALLVTNDSFVLCEVEKEISHLYVSNFWEHIERDKITIPFNSITSIGVKKIDNKEYENNKATSFAKDLLINKTIGNVLPLQWKSVAFAAFIYIIFNLNESQTFVLFGVGKNTSGAGLLDLADPILPEFVGTGLEVKDVLEDLTEIGEDGNKDVLLAKKTVKKLLSQMK